MLRHIVIQYAGKVRTLHFLGDFLLGVLLLPILDDVDSLLTREHDVPTTSIILIYGYGDEVRVIILINYIVISNVVFTLLTTSYQ